jgi:hypothetical protein
LEKDRVRRYDSADSLARDVERYLSGEPVSAGPPNTAYLLKKFITRHRVPVALGVLTLTVLLSAVLVVTSMYFKSEEHRRAEVRQRILAESRKSELERELERASRVQGLVSDSILQAAGAAGRSGDITYLTNIAKIVNDGILAGFPERDMHLRGELAILIGSRAPEVTAALVRPAIRDSIRLNGERDWKTGMLRLLNARALRGMGKYADAQGVLACAYAALDSGDDTEGDPDRLRSSLVKEYIALFEAWDSSEPDKGYDKKAENWRAELGNIEAGSKKGETGQ